MTVLRFGLTPKMKPVSPRRAAVVAGLDIGTSKIACLIARLEPQAPQDVLRRRSHGVHILGFAHTAASGMKAGGVVDLVEVEAMVRQAIDIAEIMAKVQLESVVVSLSGGRLGSERFIADIETGHHGRAPRRHRFHLGREAEAQHGHASPPCAIAGPARLAFSSPLWGRDREGGKRQKPRMRLTPLPNPPPQGGREQTVHAARLMPRLRFSFSYSPSRLP